MTKFWIVVGVVITVIVGASSISHAGYDEALLAYEKGDFKTALREFRALAKSGDPFAQYNLGVMYEFGQGVEADDTEAVKWYRRAANQNDGEAQHDLGLMYEAGNGVARSYNEARKWYRKAARNGAEKAPKSLARIKNLMSRARVRKLFSVLDGQRKVSAANAEPERECQAPDVTSQMIYHAEKVSFDLERQQHYVSAGRPLGWYYSPHKIRYETRIRRECLINLDFTINVFPIIQLHSDFKKKSKQCGRKVVLDHERRHSVIAKREFEKLATEIRERSADLFDDQRVANIEAVIAILDAELGKRFSANFSKQLNDAQEKFHNKLAERKIIFKNCAMVER